MKVKETYSIEVLGQISSDGVNYFTCDSLLDAEKKLKSMRSREIHVHIVKTVEDNRGRKEKFIID